MYNSCIYIFGGYDADGYCGDDIFKFDIMNDVWQKIAVMKNQSKEFGLDRFHHTAELLGNVVLIFGGKSAKGVCCTTTLLEYHITTNTFSSIQTIGTVPSPRWGHSSAISSLVSSSFLISLSPPFSFFAFFISIVEIQYFWKRFYACFFFLLCSLMQHRFYSLISSLGLLRVSIWGGGMVKLSIQGVYVCIWWV